MFDYPKNRFSEHALHQLFWIVGAILYISRSKDTVDCINVSAVTLDYAATP